MHTPSARTQDYDETWSGDFYLGSQTRDSVNRRFDLNYFASVACISSGTRHRGRVSESPASVRGVPGSTPEIKISIFHHIHMYMQIHKCAHPAASVSQMCTLMSNIHLYNVYVCTSNSAQNTCSKVHATLTAKKMHIYIYIHKHICIRIHMHTNTPAHQRHCTTRQCVTTDTHNQCTNMHTHKNTHVYKCIRINVHIHMHIYAYVHVCTYTYMHIYTHTHTTCIYAHTRTHLEGWRGSDCEWKSESEHKRASIHGSGGLVNFRALASPTPCILTSGTYNVFLVPDCTRSPCSLSRFLYMYQLRTLSRAVCSRV